jgi:glycosyltransferase involved in cell wall biosynthesis
MRLLILNTLEPNVNAHLTKAVAEGFSAVLGPSEVHVAQYANACATFRRQRCDAVLLFDGQGMLVPVVKELLRLGPLNILWTTEDPYELPINQEHAAWFDFVLTNDRGSVAEYGGKARHMPLAAPPPCGEPIAWARRYRDVFFCGAAWPNRVSIIRDLAARLAGLKTQFLLPYHPGVPKPDLPLPEQEWDVRLSHGDLLTAARYSKVVLYLERDYSTGGSRGRGGSPANRLYEVAALGVAQVAIADPATIAPYFEPGKEVIVVPDAAEAASAIRELLASPARLEAVAAAAQQRVLAEHTYAHRARAILDLVAERPAAAGSPSLDRHRVERPPRGSATKPAPLRALLVVHGVRGQRPWGGTELHADLIEKGLADQFDFHLLYARSYTMGRTMGQTMVHRHCRTGKERVLFSAAYDRFRDWIDPRRDAAFQKLLLEEDIHVVHFVHLLNHSLGFVQVAQALGRPTMLGLYDFFFPCPQLNLLDVWGKYCDLPAPETCDECLARIASLPHGTQLRRRELMCRLFRSVDKIHFLSPSQRQLTERVLAVPAEKALVQGIGIPGASRRDLPPPPPPLRVAVIGNVAPQKGADTLISVMQRLRPEQVQFEIAGDIQAQYRQPVEQLRRAGVTVRGAYEPEQIGEILQGKHVALFASNWPETYVIALSEALRAGLVPIVPAIGAFADRIRDRENGLVVRGDAGSYIRAILGLLDNPALLSQLRRGVLASRFLTVEEDIEGLAAVYRELAAQYGFPGKAPAAALDRDSLAPISVTAFGAPLPEPISPLAATWKNAVRLYRTRGARAVARRVCAKASTWLRSS